MKFETGFFILIQTKSFTLIYWLQINLKNFDEKTVEYFVREIKIPQEQK